MKHNTAITFALHNTIMYGKFYNHISWPQSVLNEPRKTIFGAGYERKFAKSTHLAPLSTCWLERPNRRTSQRSKWMVYDPRFARLRARLLRYPSGPAQTNARSRECTVFLLSTWLRWASLRLNHSQRRSSNFGRAQPRELRAPRESLEYLSYARILPSLEVFVRDKRAVSQTSF